MRWGTGLTLSKFGCLAVEFRNDEPNQVGKILQGWLKTRDSPKSHRHDTNSNSLTPLRRNIHSIIAVNFVDYLWAFRGGFFGDPQTDRRVLPNVEQGKSLNALQRFQNTQEKLGICFSCAGGMSVCRSPFGQEDHIFRASKWNWFYVGFTWAKPTISLVASFVQLPSRGNCESCLDDLAGQLAVVLHTSWLSISEGT